MQLEGRRVLVTGAGSGIGRGIAIRMAREGARVALADISTEAASATAELIDSAEHVKVLTCDVVDPGSVVATVEEVSNWAGGLDITVNCAGVVGRAPILEMSLDEWQRVIGVNLTGTFLVAQASARKMATQGSGVIINISSTQAEVANGDQAHYTASKGGVRALTKALAVGLAEFNIRVNAIGPGPVKTAFNRERMEDPELLPTYLRRILRGRVGEPDDVAGAAVFLASDDADWMTGTTVYVDGGMLATR